jgi:hypothetical protein
MMRCFCSGMQVCKISSACQGVIRKTLSSLSSEGAASLASGKSGNTMAEPSASAAASETCSHCKRSGITQREGNCQSQPLRAGLCISEAFWSSNAKLDMLEQADATFSGAFGRSEPSHPHDMREAVSTLLKALAVGQLPEPDEIAHLERLLRREEDQAAAAAARAPTLAASSPGQSRPDPAKLIRAARRGTVPPSPPASPSRLRATAVAVRGLGARLAIDVSGADSGDDDSRGLGGMIASVHPTSAAPGAEQPDGPDCGPPLAFDAARLAVRRLRLEVR